MKKLSITRVSAPTAFSNPLDESSFGANRRQRRGLPGGGGLLFQDEIASNYATVAPRVCVAMLGARMHYAVPRLLHETGLLARFFTDSYIGNKPWLEAALRAVPERTRPQALQRWLGRTDSVLPPGKVTSFELLGLRYGWARRRAQGRLNASTVFRDSAVSFNRHIVRVGLGSADVVWGFNGAALELFQVAKREGRKCVLEQTILPRVLESALLASEQQRWPQWQKCETDWTAPVAMDGREEAEWALADAIVAGSDFVREGLVALGVAPDKVHVIPYGVDPARFSPSSRHRDARHKDRPLRVLVVGEAGLRKGTPDLLHAFSTFRPGTVQARCVGEIALREDKLQPFLPWATFLGPVPRPQMPALFRWADVFVLPSIVEGSATVTYEAMMSGCAVITTPNAGSVVRHGVEGFIVPAGAPERLAEALRRYLDEPGLLADHRTQARGACEKIGLTRYRSGLAQLVRETVS